MRARPLGDLAVPFVLWLIAVQGLVVMARLAGLDPLGDAVVWHRPDTGLHLAVAEHGYDAGACPAPGPDLCGNASVFPGLAFLTRVADVFVPLGAAPVAVAWAFALGTLVLLASTFLRGREWTAVAATLLLAAFWPGQPFSYTAITIAPFVFFSTLWLWWLSRERFALAALASAGAILVDPLGFLLLPVGLAYTAIVHRGAPRRENATRLGLLAGAGAAAGGLVFGLMRLQTGRKDPWFDLQDQLDRELQFPLVTLWDRVRPLFEGGGVDFVAEAASLQALLVAVLVGALGAAAVRARRRLDAADRLALALGAVLWLFPLAFTGAVAHWRTDAALVPAVVLARHLPPAVAFLLGGAGVWVLMVTARGVFAGALP